MPTHHWLNGETRVKKEKLIAWIVYLLPRGSKMPNLGPPNRSDSRIDRTVALFLQTLPIGKAEDVEKVV